MDPYLRKQSISPFFHGILDMEIDYLGRTYGEKALHGMFRQVAKEVYAPLIRGIRTNGLSALARHIDEIMELEGGRHTSTLDESRLTVTVSRDPALAYLEQSGGQMSGGFGRIANKLVNEVIAEESGYGFSMTSGEKDGQYTQVWEKRG